MDRIPCLGAFVGGAATRIALALAIALAWAACTTPQPQPRDTGMLFLWQVESAGAGGAQAHLFGSVHLAREGLQLDPAVEAAFEGSAALVVELDVRGVTPADSAALVLEHGQLPQGQALDGCAGG